MIRHHQRIILDLCGGTGAWSRPYAEAGYDVRVVTIPEMDVRQFYYPGPVHGILSAPPCDDFSGSGARWWPMKDADGRTLSSLSVVDACFRIITACNPEWWAMENPSGRLKKWIDPWKFSFHPCDFGDAYTKKTLLWGKFNPPKKNPVDPVMYERGGKRGSWMWANLGGKSERTKRLRSATPPGFAQAFFEANP